MKSLSRALTVLIELSRRGDPQTLSDITDSVGLHKSTVHRMLATFTEYGLVRRDEANRYVIGLGALDLARAARGEPSPHPALQPTLAALREATGQAASYAVPRAGHLTYAAVVGLDDGRSAELPRLPLPLHSTALGKAYLSGRPKAEIDRFAACAPFPATTSRTITDAYELLRVLARARQRGFAVEDGEHAPARRRLAAPVLDQDGFAVAAVGVNLPSRVAGPDQLRRLAAAVMTSADRIATRLLDHDRPTERSVPAATVRPLSA